LYRPPIQQKQKHVNFYMLFILLQKMTKKKHSREIQKFWDAIDTARMRSQRETIQVYVFRISRSLLDAFASTPGNKHTQGIIDQAEQYKDIDISKIHRPNIQQQLITSTTDIIQQLQTLLTSDDPQTKILGNRQRHYIRRCIENLLPLADKIKDPEISRKTKELAERFTKQNKENI